MEKSGIIELKRGKARNYELFFLKRNPFPGVGVPTEGPLITVDREEEIKRFQNVMSELIDVGTGIITVLVGEYGSGKSHLLKVFKRSVNSQLLSRENGALAAYVKSPGEDFRDFLLELVEDIGRQLITEYSQEVITEYVKAHNADVEAHVFNKDVLPSIRNGTFKLETVLAGSAHLDIFRKVRETSFAEVKSADLVTSFLSLSHPDYSSIAWRWFLGERLNSDQKGVLGVGSTIDDDERAYSAFRDFVVLCKSMGIKSFLVVVDELEKITSIHATKRARYQDMLRALIDDHTRNVCFYFAIAPRQWAELSKEQTAFIRRLAGNWYVLKDFEPDNTKDLIEKYLYSVRVDGFSSKLAKSKFADCEPSLCPFTKQSIDVIQELSGGLVSNVLLVGRKLLEYLYDYQDKYDSITADFVKWVAELEHLVPAEKS